MKTAYIAGPMTGYPEFNFPAFFAAQAKLEAEGWTVKNPAAKDSEGDVIADPSFATGNANDLVTNGWDFRGAFSWDANAIIYGDGIYMLRGWEYSPGACAEHAIAKFIKKCYPAFQIMYES